MTGEAEKEKRKLTLKSTSDFIRNATIVLAAIAGILTFLFGVTAEEISKWSRALIESSGIKDFFRSYGIEVVVTAMTIILLGIAVAVLRKRSERISRQRESRAGLQNDEDQQPAVMKRYIEKLSSKSSFLPFGDHSTPGTAFSENQTSITLDDVWTPLLVSVEPNERGTDVKNKAEEYIFETFVRGESVASVHGECLRLIVLGEPGCGKSSSLARLAASYCHGMDEQLKSGTLLPISVRIDQVDLEQSSSMSAICESLDFERTERDSLQADFTKAATSGEAIFLIDGLDELGEMDKGRAAHFLEILAAEFPASAIVAACRTDDFRESPDYSALEVFRICTLQPYSLNDVLSYIGRWYSALSKRRGYSSARCESLVSSLEQAIKDDEALFELARTPLLTALIALVHANRGELPRTRSLLYYESIRLLLADAPAWRAVEGVAKPATTQAMSIANQIAYRVHTHSEIVGEHGRYGISAEEIGGIVDSKVLHKENRSAADQVILRERAAALLKQMLNSNSLIVEAGGGRYEFSHRAFQEFLVGQYFASGSKTIEVVKRASSLHWAEPLKLLANYSSVDGGNLFYVLHLCSEIFRTRDDVLSHCLVGEMLCEIGSSMLRSEDYSYVIDGDQSESGVHAGLWSAVRESVYCFAVSDDQSENHELRLRLFRVLADLGDPRLVTPDGAALPLDEQVVVMVKRTIQIGHRPVSPYLSNRVNVSNALLSYPIRQVCVDDFSMSRYLVTNLDFRRFMSAGGYETARYWPSDHARKWLKGDAGFRDLLFEGWLATAERDYHHEIQDETINFDSLRETASQVLSARKQPYYWENPRFRVPTAPVVGVNLWEAAAYCSWLTETLRDSNEISSKHEIRVPTEFEWERAARDCNENAEYPWGDEWSESCGHVNHGALDLSNAAPVGMFPKGSCPNGPLDLCGNVWEWTSSMASDWDTLSPRGKCFESTFEDVVVRGSSWYNSHELARSGIRQCDRVYNIYFDLGFRWVLTNGDNDEYEKLVG